jgi:hypothetical protein
MLHGSLYFPSSKEFDGVLSEGLVDTEVISTAFQPFRVDLELNPAKT